jgi:hypothetical protein
VRAARSRWCYLLVGKSDGVSRSRRLGTPLARALPSGFGVPHECPGPEKERHVPDYGLQQVGPISEERAYVRCGLLDRLDFLPL